jgi:hypothetical protein
LSAIANRPTPAIDPAALAFYRTQSPITDPGGHAHLLDGLPSDIPSLVAVVKGLTLHEVAARLYGVPQEDGLPEDRARFVADVLVAIQEIDAAPLTIRREHAGRVVSGCRTPPLLLVAMLRHQGVPARKRTGVARYLGRGAYGTVHDVTEYWDGRRDRWVLVDPGIDDELAQRWRAYFAGNGQPWRGEYDVLDLGRETFIVGPQLWRSCRTGQIDPRELHRKEGSLPFAGLALLEDLNSLNKVELMSHDLDFDRTANGPLELLDGMAELAAGIDERFVETRRRFDESPWGRAAAERLAALA